MTTSCTCLTLILLTDIFGGDRDNLGAPDVSHCGVYCKWLVVDVYLHNFVLF